MRESVGKREREAGREGEEEGEGEGDVCLGYLRLMFFFFLGIFA